MATRRQKLMDFCSSRGLEYAYFAKEGLGNRANTAVATTFGRASTKSDTPRGSAMLLRSLVSGQWPSSGRIDPAVTNLAIQSQTLTTWTQTRASSVADQAVAPDGTTTAEKIIEDNTAANTHLIARTFTAVSGTSYTLSFYAKAGTRTWCAVRLITSFPASSHAYFDLSSGAVGAVGAGASGSKIEAAGNGWYRCSVTATANASAAANMQLMLASADNGFTYDGDNASYIYAWGAQCETGLYAHPYIPTTTVAVSTIADVLTANVGTSTGAGNERTYAVLLEQDHTFAQLTANSTLFFHQLDTTGASVDDVSVWKNGTNAVWEMVITDDSAAAVTLAHGSNTGAGRHVIIASIKSGGSNLYVNGIPGTADTTAFTHEGSAANLIIGGGATATREIGQRVRAMVVLDYAVTQQEANILERLLRNMNP